MKSAFDKRCLTLVHDELLKNHLMLFKQWKVENTMNTTTNRVFWRYPLKICTVEYLLPLSAATLQCTYKLIKMCESLSMN